MEYKEYLEKKRDYQYKGHEFLLEMKHACLYYKPGKGKTYPCIDAVRDIDKSLNGNAKVLILSTATSIKKMWEEEIVPQNILPKNTILMSYNSAVVDATRFRLLKLKWDVIVADATRLNLILQRVPNYCFNLQRNVHTYLAYLVRLVVIMTLIFIVNSII